MKKLFLALSLLLISISFTFTACDPGMSKMDMYCLDQCRLDDTLQDKDVYDAAWDGNDQNFNRGVIGSTGVTRCRCYFDDDDWYVILFVDLKDPNQ